MTNLRPALTAALEMLGSADAVYSISVHRESLAVHVPDPQARRDIAEELGGDGGHLSTVHGHVSHVAVLATDAGEIVVEVFGKPDGVDWHRHGDRVTA